MKRIVQVFGMFVLLIAAAQAQDWVGKPGPIRLLDLKIRYASIASTVFSVFGAITASASWKFHSCSAPETKGYEINAFC